MTRRGRAEAQETADTKELSLLNRRVIDNLEKLLERRPELKSPTKMAKEMRIETPSYISNLYARKKGVSMDQVEKLATIFGVDPGIFFLPVAYSKIFEKLLEDRH
jgi:transcriptional regulator with XRE-family HTH domain